MALCVFVLKWTSRFPFSVLLYSTSKGEKEKRSLKFWFYHPSSTLWLSFHASLSRPVKRHTVPSLSMLLPALLPCKHGYRLHSCVLSRMSFSVFPDMKGKMLNRHAHWPIYWVHLLNCLLMWTLVIHSHGHNLVNQSINPADLLCVGCRWNKRFYIIDGRFDTVISIWIKKWMQ